MGKQHKDFTNKIFLEITLYIELRQINATLLNNPEQTQF